jgi:hypothetical protein
MMFWVIALFMVFMLVMLIWAAVSEPPCQWCRRHHGAGD